MKEGDWSQSASNFIEGKQISDVAADFGPRVVRKTASQFENKTKAEEETAQSNANPVASSVTKAPAAELILRSINVTPAVVNSASAVKITAAFALNSTIEPENQTEVLFTASATIKDSTGKEVEKLNLIRTSANEYSKDWNASVPAGIYSVDIAASSLQGYGNFNNVLQIEVIGSGNATDAAPAPKNLG